MAPVGIPRWSSAKESGRQCRRCRRLRSHLWAGEIPLEEEIAIHSSMLAWKTPGTEKPGGLQSMGSQRVRHDWVRVPTHTHTHTRMHAHHTAPVRTLILIFPDVCQPGEEAVSPSEMTNVTVKQLIVLKLYIPEPDHHGSHRKHNNANKTPFD